MEISSINDAVTEQTTTPKKTRISSRFNPYADVCMINDDCFSALDTIPDDSIDLIVTSPPYNLNKEYENKKTLKEYMYDITPIIKKLVDTLSPTGSICWQVGNYVDKGEVFPLDIYYYNIFKSFDCKLRNRIIWHFDHGLHAKKRLSGRYETMLWFTKSDNYTFNLDPIRVPAKYPGKRHYKPGKNYGKLSDNPLGKNPSDIWNIIIKEWEEGLWNIPNVKANHPEKTLHPCQFPIELVERCVLAFTNENDTLLDPFSGVGSSIFASLKLNRKAIACEMDKRYVNNAIYRIKKFDANELPYRYLGKPVYKPTGNEKISKIPDEWIK